MKYVGVWTALASLVASLGLGACIEPGPAHEGVVSEAGGFAEPEQRLAVDGEERYCSAEVLRWRYDRTLGTLQLADSRLLLNCCGQRAMRVHRIDSLYEITERDEPDAADPRCDSVCAFDFAVSIPEVVPGKAFVRLLRDVTDVQGSATLVWQGEIDLAQGAGEVVLDSTTAPHDACVAPAR